VIGTKKGTVTGGQKTAIWTMVRKNGMDEDEFRGWLRREFGSGSTKELSQAEAAEVIHHLKVYLGEEHEPHRQGITWGITGPQIRNVRRLAGDLGWDDPKRLAGMVQKMFSPKNRLELLTKAEGTKLIIALEKMVAEGVSPLPEEKQIR
jgi:hypothetical protein